jgi:acetyltransferase
MLENLFEAKSVAIIGAAREEGKVGHEIFENVCLSDFKGQCFPVNPKTRFIHDVKCFDSILSVEKKVDLAIIIVPAKSVPSVLEQCGQASIKNAVVISAGFKESGPEGAHLELEIIETAKKYGIRFLGPNSLGLINTHRGLNASFAKDMPVKGNISLISQSGALLTSILDWAVGEKIGFSKIVSLGNKADINENDLLQYLAEDKDTKIIVAYLENVTNGTLFSSVSKKISKTKPIIALKSGTTDVGARAVSSHTGSLAGSENAYNAAFKQSGIVQAKSVEELFDFALCFSAKPFSKVDNVAIITNAGGPGILAADACERAGLNLSMLNPKSTAKLQANLPPAASPYNPIDILGDALSDRYELALTTALNDENVDSVLCILTPQAMTEIEKTALIIANYSNKTDKSVIACFMGMASLGPALEILKRSNVPNYSFPERAVNSLRALKQYHFFLEQEEEEPSIFKVDEKAVRAKISQMLESERTDMADYEAIEILKFYGFNIPPSKVTKNLPEALEFSKKIGFPLVLKIASIDILHKSDVGGIKTNIKNEKELENAYFQIIHGIERFMPEASIEGVTVQKQVSFKTEIIIGVNRDPQFGPLLMFGLGGIYVEILKDVSFRVAPITRREAYEMVREVNTYPLLQGVRGQAGSDVDSIVENLLRLSQLVTDHPQIFEMDINPLIVGEAGQGSFAVDARISIGDVK